MRTPSVPEDRIRERAYSLWQADGCPDGCANRHWQQAEAELFYDADQDIGKSTFATPPDRAANNDTPDISRRRA